MIGLPEIIAAGKTRMPIDPQELWPKLEELGEDEVRLKVSQGVYGEKKRASVEEWLRRKEQARQVETENRRNSWTRSQTIAAWCSVLVAVVSILAGVLFAVAGT